VTADAPASLGTPGVVDAALSSPEHPCAHILDCDERAILQGWRGPLDFKLSPRPVLDQTFSLLGKVKAAIMIRSETFTRVVRVSEATYSIVRSLFDLSDSPGCVGIDFISPLGVLEDFPIVRDQAWHRSTISLV